MHFDGFWNDLEVQKKDNNVSKACIQTVYETIRNCWENLENIVFKACILTVCIQTV